jgi:hypothetical protein
VKLSIAAEREELYPDRHLNVFVPYQSHDLDYNVTRALICTLRWSRPSLARAFLTELVGCENTAGSQLLYDLQACDYEDFDPERCATRKLLGISRDAKVATLLPALDTLHQREALALLRSPADNQQRLEDLRLLIGEPRLGFDELEVLEQTLEEYERGSLPDGWIFSDDRSVCVLIEAKLTRLLDLHQLDRHADTWYGEPCQEADLVLLSWAQIARFMSKHRSDDDPRTSFLCHQLVDYLELLGLADFSGFKPYDLDGDGLLDALPKLKNFTASVLSSARESGLDVALEQSQQACAMRVEFSDSSLPGSLAIELGADSLSFQYTVGHPLGSAELSGEAGVDRVLASCGEQGLDNPLAGLALSHADHTVKVERRERTQERSCVDRSVFEDAFEPDAFLEVIDALSTQHPAADRRAEQGRSGLLTISRTLHGADVYSEVDAVLEQARTSLADYCSVARRFAEPSG